MTRVPTVGQGPGFMVWLWLAIATPLAAAAQDAGLLGPEPQALPPEHHADIRTTLSPSSGIAAGELVRLEITAEVEPGDDVTLPEQPFAPFEIHKKHRRTQPAQGGRRAFVFDLHLLAFEPGEFRLSDVRLRIVTRDGRIGERVLDPIEITVTSPLQNEPNAELKPSTQPVVVMEDDYTLAYVGAGLLGALAIAGLTLLLQRYLQHREVPQPPPPPPRPPWEVAVEQLAELRKRKQPMVEAGQAVEFVDQLSDVVRAYLGGRFGFPGLDTTTEELLTYLRLGRVASGLQDEVRAYLRRCDLVKFAKVTPDQDEVDLLFAKAQDIVQFSMPNHVDVPDQEHAGPVFAERRQ